MSEIFLIFFVGAGWFSTTPLSLAPIVGIRKGENQGAIEKKSRTCGRGAVAEGQPPSPSHLQLASREAKTRPPGKNNYFFLDAYAGLAARPLAGFNPLSPTGYNAVWRTTQTGIESRIPLPSRRLRRPLRPVGQ